MKMAHLISVVEAKMLQLAATWRFSSGVFGPSGREDLPVYHAIEDPEVLHQETPR